MNDETTNTDEPRSEPKAYVRQTTLGIDGEATHETYTGKAMTFKGQSPVEMDMEDAYTFLADPAFEVLDENGNPVGTVTRKEGEGDGRIVLDEGEIVVHMSELTQEALLTRCKLCPGSGNLSKATKKDALVEFLIAATRKRHEAAGMSPGSDTVAAQMQAGDLGGETGADFESAGIKGKSTEEMLRDVPVVETV